jgi:hypothetical protein
VGTGGSLRWAGKLGGFDISPYADHASVDAKYADDCDFSRFRRSWRSPPLVLPGGNR